MFRFVIFTACALAIATPAVSAEKPDPPAIPKGGALTEAVHKADTEMFGLFFEGCDPAGLRAMVTDDLEFYHDKDGLVTRSGDEFVAGYAKNCAARKDPKAWRSRRAVLPETLQVDPVPGFGAMEIGEHVFYERQGDGPEKLVGRAGFSMVWKLENDVWKLARVLSYAHKPVE